MKFFTIEELVHSEVAEARGIENAPEKDVVERLTQLVEKLLDPVREMWGEAIRVNSGYRNERLNAAVGGTRKSQHLRGEAADITTGGREGNRRLFEMIAKSEMEFDQMIDEKEYAWIHISYSEKKNRKQILHL